MKTRYERARELIDNADPAGMFAPDEIASIAHAIERFVLEELDAAARLIDTRAQMNLERIADAVERMAR